MKIRFALFLAIVATLGIFAISSTHSQTNKSSPTGAPLSDSERELLSEINQARANPQLYVSYLEKLKPLFSGNVYTQSGRAPLTTQEGWSAVNDAISFLKTLKPLPPLMASNGLCLAALTHVKDQGGSGATGHRSTNSNMIEDRVKPFGRWQGAIGENIAYGNDSARERLLTWLIDDGVPTRGHRRRLLSGDYQVAGISCGAHPQFSAMCVLTLAGGFTDFDPAAPKTVTTATKTTTTTPATTTKTPAQTTPAKPGSTKSKPAPRKM